MQNISQVWNFCCVLLDIVTNNSRVLICANKRHLDINMKELSDRNYGSDIVLRSGITNGTIALVDLDEYTILSSDIIGIISPRAPVSA